MERTVLVGFDGGEGARDALALAAQLATAIDASLLAVDVYPHDRWEIPPPGFAEWEEFLREDAERALAAAEREAEPRPRQIETRALAASSAARGLHESAAEAGADLLVVGSSHRARLGEILAGSVGLRLLQGSPCAVAVAPKGYRERERQGLRDLVVGYDGSAEARVALAAAAELAPRPQARLRVAGVAEAPPVHPIIDADAARRAMADAMRARLETAIDELPAGIGAEPVLLEGEPAEELAKLGAGADLLLVGSRAYGPLRRVLLGAVSSALMRSAPCPVLVFPRGAEAGLG